MTDFLCIFFAVNCQKKIKTKQQLQQQITQNVRGFHNLDEHDRTGERSPE